MKKIIRLFMAVVFNTFLCSSSPAIETAAYTTSSPEVGATPGNTVSMDFQDADLKTVLKIFSQQSGLNFVAGQNVENRTVTIYFDGVTVEDALNHIMSANNLIYEQEPGSNIFIVKESGKPVIELITKIYELKYAQLSPPPAEEGVSSGEEEADIISIIGGILSENGKLVADKRSNSLIIMDVPSQFSIIEDVLSRLDVQTPQVMIEAEILETTTTVADQLGMNWTGSFGVYAGPELNTKWPLKGGLIDKDLISTDGTMEFSGTGFSLSAILSNSDTRILARPRILTMNNETATIELTAETAVASVTTVASAEGAATEAANSAERIDTGITLEVTPQVNKDGYITMHIEPTVIVPVLSKFFAGSGNEAKFVDPQTRSAKTTVRVRNGNTIVIGGLISREDTYGFEKVPFLGDMPLLGAAFRYRSTDEVDKELLIFITPHIIDDAREPLKDISEREQEMPESVKEEEIDSLLDLLER